jgi:hypothetical protein
LGEFDTIWTGNTSDTTTAAAFYGSNGPGYGSEATPTKTVDHDESLSFLNGRYPGTILFVLRVFPDTIYLSLLFVLYHGLEAPKLYQ